MSLKDELRDAGARYVINYDFLRYFFKRTPKIAEIAAYLIDLDKLHRAEGDYFEANKAYLARGLKCSRPTVSKALEELSRYNLIDYTSDNGNGTWVRINKDKYLDLFNKYTEEMNKEKESKPVKYFTPTCKILYSQLENTLQGPVTQLTQPSNKPSKESSKELSKNREQALSKEDTTKVVDTLLSYALEKYPNTNNQSTINNVRNTLKDIYLEKGYEIAKEAIDKSERFMFIGK